jgi:predicted nucleotidyltransferase component of viral defense system
VFCGGTSLSKGYGLIQRMSEDIDFKLVLPEAWSRSQIREQLRGLRHRLVERLREAGYALPEAGITAQNENRYACFALGYVPQFTLATALRPELRLDFTVHAPQMATTAVQVEPLLADYIPWQSDAVVHQAVAVPETMVEKVVSFLRRTAGWQEQQEHDPEDAQLVRHLYDVHQLLLVTPQDASAMELQQQLFDHTVAADQEKFGRRDQLFGNNPRSQLEQALVQLQSSGEIEDLYERFVDELVWGPAVPFEIARDGFSQLASALLAGLDPPP